MSSTSTNLTGDSAIVEESVRRRAPDFAKFGFALKDVSVAGSPALQVFPIFHFVNDKTKMSIDISFFPSRQGRNGGFNILLVRSGNRKLSLKEYLREHHRSELADAFTYREPTDVREFSKSSLTKLLELLATDLKPILDGKIWEETPIDWMGYK